MKGENTMGNKPFTPEMLRLVEYLSEPAVSPDGGAAVFVRTKADAETGVFLSHLAEMDLASGRVADAVPPAACEKSPRFSPDGTALAYLSDASGEYQIFLRERGAASGKQVTMLRHGVADFDWSPDGTCIAFTAPLWREEIDSGTALCEMTPEERRAWEENREWSPVEITEIDYKNDDCGGIRDGSIVCLGTAELSSGKQKLLTDGAFPCESPAFSPDGDRIAFFGRPYSGVYVSAPELFLINADGIGLRQITKSRRTDFSAGCRPQFSPDGQSVYAVGGWSGKNGAYCELLYSVCLADGSAEPLWEASPESESGAVTVGVDSMPISRTVWGEISPCFLVDRAEGTVYFRNAWKGWENLYRIRLKEKKVEPVLVNRLNVHAFCLPGKGKMLLLGGGPQLLPELFSLELQTGALQRLTFYNAWLGECCLARTEEFEVPSRDGKTTLQVWLTHPTDEIPGKRYPVVLDIHGGPTCCYVNDFWHEFEAIAGAGMACVRTNPRGSSGYGPAFAGGGACWGKEAVDDLMQAVNLAVEKGVGDPDRVGVTGGSYGGYMTLKLIAGSGRFRAAAAQRCLANLATSYGTGDAGFLSLGREDVSGVRMLDVLTDRARHSNIRLVDRMKTPLLLLHGYRDYRCTFEQSEQMFVSMKERNPEVPVRLVMFPEDNHGITRTGKLQSQVRHLAELIGWFETYLKGGPEDERKSCTGETKSGV